MSQVQEHNWQSDSSLKAADANAAHAEAARAFAGAEQREPAAVDINEGRRTFPIGPRAVGAEGKARFHPSPSLNPQLIEMLDGYEDFGEDLGAVRNCFANAYNGLTAINAAVVALRSDPTVTPDAAVVKAVAQAERKHDHIHQTFCNTAERLHKTIETLEKSLSAPVEQMAGLGTVNDRIRDHAKSLDTGKRGKFIEEAFKKRDEKTLTALCGAPGYLSGMEDAAHALCIKRFNELREPETTRRLAVLREAATLLDRASPIAITSVERALGSSFRRAKELKAGAERSDAALRSIMSPAGE